ncbi:MAG: hypothetical protein H6698_08995 [Myxococcales bacterium]|nr:hypothetical protein [Myxococcales bacterium]MCB9520945.1 hypothetical protein [Myxococcales bacterium]MCB9531691.1 hypothetical protein [Myxococcales bacterium]MCB9534422.1 hypothetical protein [Myxococcales bacterium]
MAKPQTSLAPTRLFRRAAERGIRAAERLGESSLADTVRRATSAQLAALVSGPLTDLVDAASARLLERDAAAAQLGYLVEAIAARVGRDAALAVVLNQNLLLDGTFLHLVRPALVGGSVGAADPRHVDAGRETLLALLEDLFALYAPTASPPDRSLSAAARVDRLRGVADDLPIDDLAPFLEGTASTEEQLHVILGSYSLFLQTFLVRSVVQLAPRALQGEGAQ